MITNIILGIINGLMGWAVSILPQWSIHLPSGVTTLLGWLKSYDWILPVSELYACIGLMVSAVAFTQGVKWSIKVVDWIADVLP